MDSVAIILLCLGASFILSRVMKRFHLPEVLSPIAIGFVLGAPVIKEYLFDDLEIMSSFAEIGLIFLMFYVGLQLNTRISRAELKGDLVMAILTIALPFFVGLGVGLLFNLDLIAALVIGAIFSTISETVPIGMLQELHLLKSKVGERLIFLGTISDMVVTLQIVLLLAFMASQSVNFVLLKLLFHILIFASIVYVVIFVLGPMILSLISEKESLRELFLVSIILALGMAAAAEHLELGSLLGALVAGIIVRYTLETAKQKRPEEELSDSVNLALTLFAPFFYIWIGLNTDLSVLISAPLTGVILFASLLAAKVGSAALSALFTRHRIRDALNVGVGIAMLGGIDLIFAEIARANGLITGELFSAIVLMSVLTVVVLPVIFHSSQELNSHAPTAKA